MPVHILLLLFELICISEGTFELNSLPERQCPRDTLIFTCVTNTGQLAWRNTINNTPKIYYKASQLNQTAVKIGIISIKLNGVIFTSTFIVEHVLPGHNNNTVVCSDGAQGGEGEDQSRFIDVAAAPSQPLNVTVKACFHYLVTWASPLDTPLCVHNYTVTVRNDSSPVMVYHTTGNVTSLFITDLTPEEEYTVTVAGKDGAGRLGEETSSDSIFPASPSLSFNPYIFLKELKADIHTVFIKWKLHLKCHTTEVYYVVSHNVSGEQSPITVNRTNVTLYGVLPGEVYCVEVTAKLMGYSIINSQMITFSYNQVETESGLTCLPVWLLAILVFFWVLLLLIFVLASVWLCIRKVMSKPVVCGKEFAHNAEAQLTNVLKDNSKELDEVNYEEVGTTAVTENFPMESNIAYCVPKQASRYINM